MATHLEVGQRAPAFYLPAFPGDEKIRLSSFKGKQNVVLYFYPKDDTPGCTVEACDFRDNIKRIESSDTVILGVSPDSLERHEKFIDKYDLPFILLADEEKKLCEKYGVWVEKNNYGKKYMGVQRATFLINKKGKIAKIWGRVKVKGHVDAVLAAIDELE